MDSDSIGDRHKDIQLGESDDVGNVNESMEEDVPKILNPGIQDVFHIFVNMLDVKSYMKLAMTSKKMYKRCTEDTSIRVSVDMNRLHASNESGFVEFAFSFPNISYEHRDGFVAALRKLPCKVNLQTLEISDFVEAEISDVSEVQKFMKEIGVNKIHELSLYHSVWKCEAICVIIRDFNVKAVSIRHGFNENLLRSLLQLNLKKLTHYGPVPVALILEIDSPIQEISFPDVDRVSKEQLMDILEKIQSGSLRLLTVDSDAVDWDEFHGLPFDHEGPLPDDRPLLLEKTTDDDDDEEEDYYYDSDSDYGYAYDPPLADEYWFLHWHGGVTKCIVDDYLYIFKCDPWDYPWILRKEEDILNDLSDKRPRVSCSSKHFHTFCESLTMIDCSQEGSLPDDRPIYFKTPENDFWMLGEDDNLMECAWEDGFATWKPYDPSDMEIYEQPALAKYMFWKVVGQMEEGSNFTFYCNGIEEFNSWFENFEKLDFEYSGVLSSERPLVFERASSERKSLRVLLIEDRLLQCKFAYDGVSIKLCHYLNRPLILFSAKYVLQMLQDACRRNVQVNVHYKEFLDGLNQFKRSSLVLQKRILISKLVVNELWYWMEDAKLVKKVAWKEGRLSVIEDDLCGSPPGFMKEIFRIYAEAKSYASFTMELEEFRSCLEQFSVVPFDYSGPLTSYSSLAFVKKNIHHTCGEVLLDFESSSEEVTCECSEVSSVLVWLLWKGLKVTKCSWGEKTPKEVLFETNFIGMPPAFKSKEYLKFLLQEKYDKSARFEWFGRAEDFRAYLEDFMKLPFDYEGPLPEERPLLFEKNKHSRSQFLIRSDGTIIECALNYSSVKLSLLSSHHCFAPPALKGML